jgi:hypothetical protein
VALNTDIISRDEWGAKPPKAVTPWNIEDLLGVTIHHFGTPRAAASHAGCDDLLRSVQSTHMAPGGLDTTDGANDIAYNFGVCPHGRIFELRGWDAQTGANGTTSANENFLAFVYMGHSDLDGFPEVSQDLLGFLLKQAFNKGVGVSVVPHRKFTGSECPGDRAHKWVVTGGWKADLKPERAQFLLIDDGGIVAKSRPFPIAESKARWEKFRSSAGNKAHARMVEEGNRGTVQFVRKVITRSS